jgi:hypothetical protein
VPPGWSVSRIEPWEIPEPLFPRSLSDEAVSQRSPELLAHMMSCPVFEDAGCYVLRQMNVAMAYFCLEAIS